MRRWIILCVTVCCLLPPFPGSADEDEIQKGQSAFGWLPDLSNPQRVMIWTINTFLVSMKGGSFYELSLEDIYRYFKAIPEPLKTAEHLGFHDVAGIRPFSFTASDNTFFEIPQEQKDYFGEMTESVREWIQIYEAEGLGGLIGRLDHTPLWLREIELFKTALREAGPAELRAILGEHLWKLNEMEEKTLSEALREVSSIFDAMTSGDPRLAMIEKLYFSLALLKGITGIKDGKKPLLDASPLSEKAQWIQSAVDDLIRHEFVANGEKRRSHLFILNKLRAVRGMLQKKRAFKEGDQKEILFLVANGLSATLRGHFCESPSRATGTQGKHYQYRNSALMRDNLTLVPMMDGQIRGYVELMAQKIEGDEKKVLVLREIQFDGLTDRNADILFSYLNHMAKKAGFAGLALPENLDEKSAIDGNKTIIQNMKAYQQGKRVIVNPLHEKEWQAARQSSGSKGRDYYKENEAGRLLDNGVLLPGESLKIRQSLERPVIDCETAAFRKRVPGIREVPREALLGIGLNLREDWFKTYQRLLEKYDHGSVKGILEKRGRKNFSFKEIVSLMETEIPKHLSEERREKEIKDKMEYLLKAIQWQRMLDREGGAEFLSDFRRYLGEDRFLRAYQASTNLRTEKVLDELPESLLIRLGKRIAPTNIEAVRMLLDSLENASDREKAKEIFEKISEGLEKLSKDQRGEYLLEQIKFLKLPKAELIVEQIIKTPGAMLSGGAHFGAALFVKHTLQYIFELDHRPMEKFINYLPEAMVDYLLFAGGSALGFGAYRMGVELPFQLYRQLVYRKLILSTPEARAKLSKQFGTSGINGVRNYRIYSRMLKRQAAFIAALTFTQWWHTGEIDGKQVAISWLSFAAAGVVVEAGLDWMIVRIAGQTWKLKNLTGPWGWMATAVELGITLLFADEIERAVYERLQRDVHIEKIGEKWAKFKELIYNDQVSSTYAINTYKNHFHPAMKSLRDFMMADIYETNAVYLEAFEQFRRGHDLLYQATLEEEEQEMILWDAQEGSEKGPRDSVLSRNFPMLSEVTRHRPDMRAHDSAIRAHIRIHQLKEEIVRLRGDDRWKKEYEKKIQVFEDEWDGKFKGVISDLRLRCFTSPTTVAFLGRDYDYFRRVKEASSLDRDYLIHTLPTNSLIQEMASLDELAEGLSQKGGALRDEALISFLRTQSFMLKMELLGLMDFLQNENPSHIKLDSQTEDDLEREFNAGLAMLKTNNGL